VWHGHLGVAKWLFEVGADEDIRTMPIGWTPMYTACWHGHLDVAKWLFEMGAAEDIRTTSIGCKTPLAMSCRNIDVATWLILQGAANDDDGHVDPAILQRAVHAGNRPRLIPPLQLLVNENASFQFLVLTAARFTAAPQKGALLHDSEKRANSTPRCALELLRGLEGSVLRLIADFAGVVRGRQLQNAREALHAFSHG